ncbi:MAG: glycerol-3-phosphate 1-O-acyltransferase PlsY [Eubacteriales bacterium]|nr:glycerol-3-phosphate 1-O-acyltransferase PlsY [Eubacteriales bacterium]
MNGLLYAAAAIGAYLIGNIQTAVIISRLKYKDDVRNHGSGNAGSTNMLRVFGIKPGIFTFIGDFLKGVLAVLLGRWLAGDIGGCVAGLFVVVGHCYPVFLKFRGGKGVASTFAVAWMMNPLFAGIVTVVALVLILTTKTVAVMSLVGTTLYLVLTLVFSWSNTYIAVLFLLLWLIVMVRHIENIQRIFKGQEGHITVGSHKNEVK